MLSRLGKIILLFVLFSALILPIFVFNLFNLTYAEGDLEGSCQVIMDKGQQSLSKENYQSMLKKCLDFYEGRITEIGKDINETGAKKKTLENKIYTLNKKIKNLNYQIYKSNLIINDLGLQIESTKTSIVKTSTKIEESKNKLANILRNINEEDQKPAIEILFSEDDLSAFFDNLMALERLDNESKKLLENIKFLKINLEAQQHSLNEDKLGVEETVQIQKSQKKESSKTKKDQEYYLGITKEEYQKQLKEKESIQKKATEIRTRLFKLVGVAKGGIEFGEAVKIAKYVENLTGIRPAFLLAIIAQESMRYGKFGGNVGQCYLKNLLTGEGVIINSGKKISKVMKPSRDIGPFQTITKELGRNPYSTPVSCPMSFGYGGAMGPAQFIPSTWILYKDKLASILGRPCDPWNIQDSFVAAGLYLSESGAATQTRKGEWRAAMIYFAGSTTKSAYYWYANQVLDRADQFQEDIDALKAANK